MKKRKNYYQVHKNKKPKINRQYQLILFQKYLIEFSKVAAKRIDFQMSLAFSKMSDCQIICFANDVEENHKNEMLLHN